MIHNTYLCNLCRNQIRFHPDYGLDGLTLYQKGPVGAEYSVLDRDEDDWKGDQSHSRYPCHTGGFHFCHQCETGLRRYFGTEKR